MVGLDHLPVEDRHAFERGHLTLLVALLMLRLGVGSTAETSESSKRSTTRIRGPLGAESPLGFRAVP